MDRRRRLQARDYTVGWICALPIELAAAQEMLDERDEAIPDDDDFIIYTLGRIDVHNVVLACLPAGNTGTQSAATVAARMRSRFKSIRFGLMVGIGGGVPSIELDIRLGDVVISQPYQQHGGVVQYDFGKTGTGGNTIRTGWLNAPPPVLLSAVVEQRARHMRQESVMETYLLPFKRLQNFNREVAGADVLFEATYDHVGKSTCEICSDEKQVRRAERKNTGAQLHYGTIASGNQVMKDGVTRDKISKELGGVMCFEMEAAGLMNDFPCLVIRGVCDYADSHKNKKWQPYAAATAAVCAREILSIVPGIPKISVNTTTTSASETVQTRIETKLDQLFQEIRLGFKPPAMFAQDLKKNLVDDDITEVDVEENRDLISDWIESTQEDTFHELRQNDQRNSVDANIDNYRSQQNTPGNLTTSNTASQSFENSSGGTLKNSYGWSRNSEYDSLSDDATETSQEESRSPPGLPPTPPPTARNKYRGKKKNVARSGEEAMFPRRVNHEQMSRSRSRTPSPVSKTGHWGKHTNSVGTQDMYNEDMNRQRMKSRYSLDNQQQFVEDSYPRRPRSTPNRGRYERSRRDRFQDESVEETAKGSKPDHENVIYERELRERRRDAANYLSRQQNSSLDSLPPHLYTPYPAYERTSHEVPQANCTRPDQRYDKGSFHFTSNEGSLGFDFSRPESIFAEFLRDQQGLTDSASTEMPDRQRSHKSTDNVTKPPPPREIPLLLSLEELFSGTIKEMTINSTYYDAAKGRPSHRTHILKVPIKRGLKAGSKIKFANIGDEFERGTQDVHYIEAQDVHYIIGQVCVFSNHCSLATLLIIPDTTSAFHTSWRRSPSHCRD